MRDYLSPAKKAAERVMPHPAAIRSFMIKRRSFVFLMAVTFVVITTLGFVTVRAVTGAAETEQKTVKEEGKSSTLSTNTTSNSSSGQPSTSQSITTETKSTTEAPSTSSNDSHTSVTINNETVPVPANGSVQRTITNDNGTTQVNVSTNSDSAGNSYSSSFTTNNASSFNSSMSTSSQSVIVTGP